VGVGPGKRNRLRSEPRNIVYRHCRLSLLHCGCIPGGELTSAPLRWTSPQHSVADNQGCVIVDAAARQACLRTAYQALLVKAISQ
jgi:hypothetical protein